MSRDFLKSEGRILQEMECFSLIERLAVAALALSDRRDRKFAVQRVDADAEVSGDSVDGSFCIADQAQRQPLVYVLIGWLF